jgi:hypothetical protein
MDGSIYRLGSPSLFASPGEDHRRRRLVDSATGGRMGGHRLRPQRGFHLRRRRGARWKRQDLLGRRGYCDVCRRSEHHRATTVPQALDETIRGRVPKDYESISKACPSDRSTACSYDATLRRQRGRGQSACVWINACGAERRPRINAMRNYLRPLLEPRPLAALNFSDALGVLSLLLPGVDHDRLRPAKLV